MSIGNAYCPTLINMNPLKDLIEIEKSIQKKYRSLLWSPFIKALKNFELVKENDVIAIAISGGKDSLLLAKLFQELKRASKINFDIKFISMNPGFNSKNLDNLIFNLNHLNIPCEIYDENIFDVCEKIAKDYPCYLCSKMRRGSLYAKAKELGCNKLALGHHLDDVIETTLMSVFYNGKFETMLPKLKSDNFEIELIRPLFYVEEKDITKFINSTGLTPMNCGCTVSALKTSSKRFYIKNLIKNLVSENSNIKYNILSSISNVNIEKILSIKFKNKKYSIDEISKFSDFIK